MAKSKSKSTVPPSAAAAPETDASPSKTNIALLEAQLAAAKAKRYAMDNPVKATGIVTTVALAVFGGYKLVREITG